MTSLSVRAATKGDVPLIVDYWLSADEAFLRGMGADIHKLPDRDILHQQLCHQVELPIEEKRAYALIWEEDGQPIGHSNTNPTFYGEKALMHLHIWKPDNRKKGRGLELVKLSTRKFFEDLKIQTLYCQPYAHNPAPNKTLLKAGFEFVKTYTTTPGSINFEQEVNLYKLKAHN